MPREFASFELTRQLPHLLRRAHFAAETEFSGVFSTSITSRQLALLMAVAKAPGASQADIAQTIGLDQNTCSDLVARVETKRLIRREHSPGDRRIRRLYLTAAGKRMVARALPHTAPYERLVARRLSAAEREKLIELLRLLLGFDDDKSPH